MPLETQNLNILRNFSYVGIRYYDVNLSLPGRKIEAKYHVIRLR